MMQTPAASENAFSSGFVYRRQLWLILLGFLFVLLWTNYLWLRLDHTPLTMDEADHLSNSMSYYRWWWQSAPKESLRFYELLPYPPLVGWLTHLVFPFFGFSAHAAILFIQSLFAVVLMLALYGVAQFLCREYEASVLGSLLVFLYPVTFIAARHYLLDLPLTAMAALSMFLLLRLNRYGARRDALLLGLTLGLGMLVKWSFAFYLALPTLLVLIKMFRAQSARRALAHAGWIILVALLVTVPWYGPRLSSDWAMAQRNLIWVQSPHDLLWTKRQGLLFYLTDFFNEVSPLGALFFLLGSLFFLKKGLTFERWLLLAWIVGPVIILTLIRFKNPRYALPYLPAIALITVIGLYEIKWKRWQRLLSIAGIVLLLAQYYALSFSADLRPRLGNVSLFQPERIEFFTVYPSRQDWHVDEILQQLTKGFDQFPDQKRVVFLISNHEIYNANTFNCLSDIKQLGIRFVGGEYAGDPVQVTADDSTSYILLMESSSHTFFDANRERVIQAMDLIRSQPAKYIPVHSLTLPDGSFVTLYVKKNGMDVTGGAGALEQLQILGRGRIAQLAYAPNGRKLAVSTGAGIEIWDTATWQREKQLVGHTNLAFAVRWSGDASRIASGSDDKTIKIWDAQTGTVLKTLTGHTDIVESVSWSPDATKIVSGSVDRTIKIWNVRTGDVIRTLAGHSDPVTSVAWSPEASKLASGARDSTVKIWDAQTGVLIRTLTGHTSEVWSVAWSPDARRIASGSLDGMIKIWDVQTGDVIRTLAEHTAAVWSLAWAPGSGKFASASMDNAVKIWDAQTGVLIRTLTGHTSEVWSVSWSPNGSEMASSSKDSVVKIWNTQTGEVLRSLTEYTSEVWSVAWSLDARKIVSGSMDRTVKLWDVETGAVIRTLAGHTSEVRSVSWSPDGSKIASGSRDGAIKIWNAKTGEAIRTLTAHLVGVRCVAWSPDASKLASGAFDGAVKIWDAQTGALIRTFAGHVSEVSSIAWSPDSSKWASGSLDGAIKIWDAHTGALIRTFAGQTDPVTSISWSPDSRRIASGSLDGTIKIWDAQTGAALRILTGRTNSVASVSWSPDASKIASGSSDGAIKIWDAQTGKVALTGNTGSVESVVWSPDSRNIASGSMDGTVRVWGLGKQLKSGIQTQTHLLPDPERHQTLTSNSDSSRAWSRQAPMCSWVRSGNSSTIFSAAWPAAK